MVPTPVAQRDIRAAAMARDDTFILDVDEPGWPSWPDLHRVLTFGAMRPQALVLSQLDNVEIHPVWIQDTSSPDMIRNGISLDKKEVPVKAKPRQ